MDPRTTSRASGVRRLVLGAALALAVSGCGAPDVQVASGDGPEGQWTAAIHQMGNGLFPDDRVCVRVRVEGGGTIESGCGFNDPISSSAEMSGTGLVVAQTWVPTATQARFEVVGVPAVVVPLAAGDPVSRARWMVLWMNPAVAANLPVYTITFLDADGRQVDAVRR